MRFITVFALFLSSLALARPSLRQRQTSIYRLQNGMDAVKLNNQFMSLSEASPCTSGSACINGQVARCVNGQYVLSACSPGLTCAALPLVNSAGTSIACTTHADLVKRIAATGATNGTTPANGTDTPNPTSTSIPCPMPTSGYNSTTPANGTGTPNPTSTSIPCPMPTSGYNSTNSSDQTSLTLLSSVIATNFSQNGLNTSTTETGQVASLISTNNFINWCATLPSLPNTNGQQLKNGSCNSAPMGAIPASSNMPSSKFVTPVNLAVIPSNATFQITLAVMNLATGYSVNSATNYLAAPQQLDPTTGFIQGHAHVVIEALEALNQTTPTNPTKFAFFAVLSKKADANGYLFANVTGGLPEGAYRMTATNNAMNHQLLVLPIAERGASDDTIYFTVTGAGQSTNSTTGALPPSGSISPSPVVPSPSPMPTPTGDTGNSTDPCDSYY